MLCPGDPIGSLFFLSSLNEQELSLLLLYVQISTRGLRKHRELFITSCCLTFYF